MEEEKKTKSLLCKNSKCRYLPLQQVWFTSHPFECGLNLMTCFERIKRKKIPLQGRNLADTTLAKWPKLTAPGIIHVNITPNMMQGERHLTSVLVLPQTPNPSPVNIKQTQTREFYKNSDQQFSKLSTSWNKRKTEELWQIERDLRKHSD